MFSIVVDIETIPTSNQVVIDRLKKKVQPPANYKSEDAIEKWWATTGEEKLLDVVRNTALNGAFGEVIAIGYAVIGEDGKRQEITCLTRNKGESESVILEAFSEVLRSQDGMLHKLIGHNVSWDARFLWQRAVVNGVHLPVWWPKNDRDRAVFDTMREWAGWKDTISLDALAFALLGKGKTGVGTDVFDQFEAEDYSTISAYCMNDVDLTYQIYEKMK
jgi:hypothetical protein